jgi:hypothetical protein
MATANKFNIHWQIIRTEARKIKDVQKKIAFVVKFLNDNKNIHNYGRVHNWLKMTGVAYKGEKREWFEDAVRRVESDKDKYTASKDMDNDLSKVSRKDLEMVYKDLKKRKYGFQYKTIPKAHTDFLKSLEDALDEDPKIEEDVTTIDDELFLDEGPKDAQGKSVFVKKIAKSAGVSYKAAGAIAAAAGRKRLGKKAFDKKAAEGRKKAAAKKSN